MLDGASRSATMCPISPVARVPCPPHPLPKVCGFGTSRPPLPPCSRGLLPDLLSHEPRDRRIGARHHDVAFAEKPLHVLAAIPATTLEQHRLDDLVVTESRDLPQGEL